MVYEKSSIIDNFRMRTHLELLSSVVIERSIIIQDIDELKSVADTNLVIVGIMGWRDLHCTSSKFLVNLFVDDDGQTPVQKGMDGELAVKVL